MANATAIDLNSTVVASKQQTSSEISGEVVILDLQRGVYHGLNQTGALIWQMIQKPCKVASIRDTLLREYHVDALQCEQHLLALLEELASKGLLEVRPAAVG